MTATHLHCPSSSCLNLMTFSIRVTFYSSVCDELNQILTSRIYFGTLWSRFVALISIVFTCFSHWNSNCGWNTWRCIHFSFRREVFLFPSLLKYNYLRMPALWSLRFSVFVSVKPISEHKVAIIFGLMNWFLEQWPKIGSLLVPLLISSDALNCFTYVFILQ